MAHTFKSVGFIGLGLMGMPMLENLIKKLPDTTRFFVYDVSAATTDSICSRYGARVKACENARDVADQAETVLSMVPEGSHVRSVYLTPGTGVLASDVSGKLLIDCSTIDTASSIAVRDEALERYPTAAFYDAPVSGGVLGAQKATLTIMIGCAADDPAFPRLEALLGTMGKSIIPCGGPALGLTAKLCNNYCSGLIAIATSEAMNIGMRAGIDPRVLASVFHNSTAQSAICDKWCPVPGLCPEAPPSNGYKGGFKIQLMRKDFALAVDTAKRVGATLALGEAGLQTYTEAMSDPQCKDLDSRVVYRFLGGKEDWQKDIESEEPHAR